MKLSMTTMIKTFVLSMLLTLFTFNMALAAIDVYEFDSPQQEAQYRGLIAEFRCPKCQNQNLAGSDAPIAQDLKQKTYEMVQAGQSDAQIREYMYDRYGDFISYKPPVRPSTWILWFFPPLLLLILIAGWVWRTKRQNQAMAISSNATSAKAETASTQTDSDSSSIHSSNMDATLASDNEVATNKPDVASNLTSAEKEALSALLAEHDDTPIATAKQNENTPNKGDK